MMMKKLHGFSGNFLKTIRKSVTYSILIIFIFISCSDGVGNKDDCENRIAKIKLQYRKELGNARKLQKGYEKYFKLVDTIYFELQGIDI